MHSSCRTPHEKFEFIYKPLQQWRIPLEIKQLSWSARDLDFPPILKFLWSFLTE